MSDFRKIYFHRPKNVFDFCKLALRKSKMWYTYETLNVPHLKTNRYVTIKQMSAQNPQTTIDKLLDRILTKRGARRKRHIAELKLEFQALHTEINTLRALLDKERVVVSLQKDTIKHVMKDKKAIEKRLLELEES